MQDVPKEVFGGWKLERTLGQGADGTVALYSKPGGLTGGRQMAVLKFPKTTLQARQSFEQEKAVTGLIREQPRKHLVGQKFATSGFLAQDYVEGITLEQFGQRYDFTIETANSIIDQLEAGVKALHDLGFAHNDLHLANILINPTTQDVWIIDYGRSVYTSQDIQSVHPRWPTPGVPITENDRAYIAAASAWLANLASRPCKTRDPPTPQQVKTASEVWSQNQQRYLRHAKPGPIPAPKPELAAALDIPSFVLPLPVLAQNPAAAAAAALDIPANPFALPLPVPAQKPAARPFTAADFGLPTIPLPQFP